MMVFWFTGSTRVVVVPLGKSTTTPKVLLLPLQVTWKSPWLRTTSGGMTVVDVHDVIWFPGTYCKVMLWVITWQSGSLLAGNACTVIWFEPVCNITTALRIPFWTTAGIVWLPMTTSTFPTPHATVPVNVTCWVLTICPVTWLVIVSWVIGSGQISSEQVVLFGLVNACCRLSKLLFRFGSVGVSTCI